MEDRREGEEIIIRGLEILGFMYLIGWFFKKMWHHPTAAIMFLGLTALAVCTAYLFPSHDWEFYPVAASALLAFARTVRKN